MYPHSIRTISAAHGGHIHIATHAAGERFRPQLGTSVGPEYKTKAAATAWLNRKARER